jgi:hypothetical protein
MEQTLQGTASFLWPDESPERAVQTISAKVSRNSGWARGPDRGANGFDLWLDRGHVYRRKFEESSFHLRSARVLLSAFPMLHDIKTHT